MGASTSDRSLTLYVDGASRGNPGPSAIGVVIKDEQGATRLTLSSYIGAGTNNRAEYTALIMGLREAARLGAKEIDVRSDSELLVEQVRGAYKVRNINLRPLFEEVKELLAGFASSTVSHIPRSQNRAADLLANEALDRNAGR